MVFGRLALAQVPGTGVALRPTGIAVWRIFALVPVAVRVDVARLLAVADRVVELAGVGVHGIGLVGRLDGRRPAWPGSQQRVQADLGWGQRTALRRGGGAHRACRGPGHRRPPGRGAVALARLTAVGLAWLTAAGRGGPRLLPGRHRGPGLAEVP